MAATIMMPQQIDAAIREMCSDAMGQAVAVLAEKYGFDVEDANRLLDSSTLKIVRKRGPQASPKKDEKTKGKGKAKASVDGDKPKRGKTGYLLYADEVREEVKASLTAELGDGEKLKPQETVKAIAARWKAEDQSVRDEWGAKAKTPATSDDESAQKELPIEYTPAPVVKETKAKKVAKAKKVTKKAASSDEDGSNSE